MTVKPRSAKVPPLLELSDRVAKIEVDRQREKDRAEKRRNDAMLGWLFVFFGGCLIAVGVIIGIGIGTGRAGSSYEAGYQAAKAVYQYDTEDSE